MEELRESPSANESLRKLPNATIKKLLVVKGNSDLQLKDLDDELVKTQEGLGTGTDDYERVAQIHQRMGKFHDAKVLGVREEVRKRRIVIEGDGTETELVEMHPSVKNIWIGENVKLLTPDQAANTHHASHTALEWATVNGVVPEMVVKASNGLFYPATKNDVVISPKK